MRKLLLVVLLLGGCSFESVPFSGELVDFEAIDEANLSVSIEFTNKGDESASGECTVEAHDASRVVGFDILQTEDIPAGGTELYNGAIRIEDEGAFRVVEVTVTECEEAT